MNFGQKLLITLALSFAAASSQAAVTWTFGDSSSNLADNGHVRISDMGNVSATITAWAGSSPSGSSSFETADLREWTGGLGAYSQYSRDLLGRNAYHTVGDGYVEEFLLFEFSHPVSVTEIGTRYSYEWYSNDVDASVLAYTGGGSPLDMTSYSSSGASALTSNGWVHADTSFGGESTSTSVQLNASVDLQNQNGQVFSHYWLIGNSNEHISTADSYEDFFKLNLVTVNKGPVCQPGDPGCGGSGGEVPAPATAALLGLGLLLLRARKRSQ